MIHSFVENYLIYLNLKFLVAHGDPLFVTVPNTTVVEKVFYIRTLLPTSQSIYD